MALITDVDYQSQVSQALLQALKACSAKKFLPGSVDLYKEQPKLRLRNEEDDHLVFVSGFAKNLETYLQTPTNASNTVSSPFSARGSLFPFVIKL
jgi:hypothetical protein